MCYACFFFKLKSTDLFANLSQFLAELEFHEILRDTKEIIKLNTKALFFLEAVSPIAYHFMQTP